ncbi:hypothetical protein N9O61_02955 [Octadecabacter sp.]|nr:hypothetical protein [Octadecabacter sp.]
MIPIYHGFDGLEFAINVAIPEHLCIRLQEAQATARDTDDPVQVGFGSDWLVIHPTGARGGYAFRCTHAKTGEWFFKKPLEKDPWGVRFSCASQALALHGLEGVRQMCKALLESLDIDAPDSAYCPSRVDFAVDFIGPDFKLDPDLFVVHSNTGRRTIADIETIDIHARSNRTTSVTVGKMPGRQVIIYDKTQEVLAHRKFEWHKIWDRALASKGLTRDHAPIWRVEVRVAKRHLKDNWNVKSWASLYELLPEIFQKLLSDIRYCAPSIDSNRSRWEPHQMWQDVSGLIETDLFNHVSTLSPDEYIEVKREQKIESVAARLEEIKAALEPEPPLRSALETDEPNDEMLNRRPEHIGLLKYTGDSKPGNTTGIYFGTTLGSWHWYPDGTAPEAIDFVEDL